MSKIKKLIQQYCPDGVKYKKISEVAQCLAGATPKTSIATYWENGTIPWMSSGEVNNKVIYKTETKITQEGYDSCSTKIVPPNAVVIALAGQGKTRGTVAITRIALCTNQSLCSIITSSELVPEFLYHYLDGQYLKLRDISSGDGTRGGLNLKMIRDFLVPVPPLEVQQEIVRILDQFTQLTAELTAELTARKQQYVYYRNKVLSFEENIQEEPLRECGVLLRGEYITKKESRPGNIPVILGGQEPAYYIDHHNHTGPAIVVSRSGASAGFISYWDEPIFVTDGFIIEGTNKVDIRFLYHFLKNSQERLNKTKRGGGVPHITGKNIGEIKIPLPPLPEQRRIVAILDRFDALCNDLTRGLPAEIAARQKQYEYYRDKLLTFPQRKEADA